MGGISERPGVVYTKRWVVDLILDLVGYLPGSGIASKVMLEPACGRGAFLTASVERLAREVTLKGFRWESLESALRGYEIDPVSAMAARESVKSVLKAAGCPRATAEELSHAWIREEDFILADAPLADFIVGNPPYVRASEIDRQTRDLYCSLLPSVSASCDLYVSFFDRGLNLLRNGGVLCYICADRWMQNGYGRKLRERVSRDFCLETVICSHGGSLFEKEVSAYPAVPLIRNCPPPRG